MRDGKLRKLKVSDKIYLSLTYRGTLNVRMKGTHGAGTT